jgi:ankyrin repeat protein
MRLLRLEDNGVFSLVEYIGRNIPRYAILSHTWGADHEEVTFRDLTEGTGKSKTGYRKLTFCAKRATHDGLQFFWVDTCCIDKSSSTELTEAINSMFRWYQDAARCYVYLSDVSVSGSIGDDELSRRWKPAFKRSRWFTRGWTLQELIAPKSVEFFSKEEERLGDKRSLEQTLYEITGIAIRALQGSPLSHFTVDERMSWAAKRQTKREEDEAYSLLGIFDIHMPLLYGERREKALARLQKGIKKSLKDDLLSLDDQRRMLLDSLRFDQIDARQMTIKNAHAKTCKWLLEKSDYLNWLDTSKLGEHHGFLWIKGKPGTGKSTLMKFASADARKTMKDSIVFSFFFNARGEGLEKSTIGTYRSLLLQLLERLPALQCVFDSLGLLTRTMINNHQWSAEPLKMLLEQATQRLGESSVVCFIDALDECEERQIRDMISFFEHVGELAVSTGIKFRVCLSSRHYPYITIQKNLDLVLDRQEGHDQDIANYLASELKIGHSKVAEEIRTEIQGKASGIFMWVILVVGILNKEHDRGRMYALRRRLREIPSDLHKLFRDILIRDSHNSDELVLCIQWVLFARQPLSPEQLYFALLSGVEPESLSRWDPNEITRDVIKRFILDSSKGLAEITTSENPKVQFIHESVKDFLLKENALGSIWPDLGSNFQGQSHERLKNSCLNYMGIKDLPKFSPPETAYFRQSAIGTFPFLKYAVRNVLYHADVAEGCGVAQENFLQSFQLVDWIKLENLIEYEPRRYTEDVSLLYLLAEGNMSNLIRVHPSILSYLEVGKERYGPPLFAALATRSKEAVEAFVEIYAATQSLESRLHNLCSRYRYNEGSWGKFRHDFKFSNSRTTLSYLAELGDEVIFALGLEIGNIMPDSKDQDGRTPLSWAAAIGHPAVVQLLLATDRVDVNSKDDYEQMPLSYAAEYGHAVVVQQLLATRRIDVNSKDDYGRTPLLLAAEYGHEAVVQLLLATRRIDVNSKDNYGRTPLSWAAALGHEAVVQLLLDTDRIDVNSKDGYGQTPLAHAAEEGYEAVVQLLLANDGVHVNSKNKDGWTPLAWAAANGHEAVVQLLQSRNHSC